MNTNYDPHIASAPPLRAQRHDQQAAQMGLHPDASHTGLQGSPGGLLRATIGSALVALVLLVAVVLPAEYNIDPLRIGRLLGLSEMGEIKAQLSAEAAAEDAALANASLPDVLARLIAIEAQLRDVAAVVGARSPGTPASPAPSPAPEAVEDAASTAVTALPAATAWRDEVNVVLTPGEGIELKLVMDEGAAAEFQWTANGSVLNYDTHGDGGGQRISYEKGRGVPSQSDRLVAAFTGNHGWFFRNRTDQDVTLTLQVRGEYVDLIGAD